MRSFGSLTLRARVGLLIAVGVGLVAALVSVAAYVTVRISLLDQVDQNLLARAHAAVSSPLGDPSALVQIPSEALGAADVKIALTRADGAAYSAKGQQSAPPLGTQEFAVARGELSQSVRTAVGPAGEKYRVVAVPAGHGLALVLAQSTAETEHILGRLGLVLLVVGGGGVLLAGWSGLGIARAGLRPVELLTRAAEHVARTHDLRPIPVHGEDELARLAHSFNAMLGALGQARTRERRLIADAGHELRTPLTSLRTNLDLLAQSEQQPGLPPEDRLALLRDVQGQVLELSTLVGDLVELAREDQPTTARQPLDLADVLGQALERVRRRAPGVTFSARAGSWTVFGDGQLLERALTNLLDNAAKWSPAGGTVVVELRHGVLTVLDEGPGIADTDLPHVFDRFYRSAEARTLPGSGLGLAIVKQAAERHGGNVAALPGPRGGALFRLWLPGTPAASDILRPL